MKETKILTTAKIFITLQRNNNNNNNNNNYIDDYNLTNNNNNTNVQIIMKTKAEKTNQNK